VDRPTLVKSDLFYPPSIRSPEQRLRFYAERFNTVEVDSTYYALPVERNGKLWAERTLAGFLFNIKPFALMTQHPAEMSRLPIDLRHLLPAAERRERRLTNPPLFKRDPEAKAEVLAYLNEALTWEKLNRHQKNITRDAIAIVNRYP
jgi:uncharacterized protein YecE (DUF72 family)